MQVLQSPCCCCKFQQSDIKVRPPSSRRMLRLPPLAALLATRFNNSSVCLVLLPLRRNQQLLTFFTLLVLATLLYISLVISQQQSDSFQSQVSSYTACQHSSGTGSSSSSNDTTTIDEADAHLPSVSAAAAASAQNDPLMKVAADSNNSNSNSNSSEVLPRVSRQFLSYLVGNLRDSRFPGARNYSEYHLMQHPQRFRILSGVQPLRADFGPVVNDVTSFGYPIDIAPCQNINNNHTSNSSSNNSIGLFLAVISAPGYFDKRQVIRQTWLSQLMTTNNQLKNASVVRLVGHGFVVGLTKDKDIQKRIEQESATHGDILQVNTIDTYADLTRKVTATWNWISSRCSKVDFVLKVDDDVYVNTRNLISVVKSLNSSHQSIVGTSADGIVRRDGKFAVSLDDWPWSNYPPYSMGAFLLMSGCVIQSLLAAAQTTPYFPFEDAYIGLCADKARVKMRFSPRALAGFMSNKPQPCYVHNSISWLTKSAKVAHQSHNATEEFYRNVTRCKNLVEMPIDPHKTPRKFNFT